MVTALNAIIDRIKRGERLLTIIELSYNRSHNSVMLNDVLYRIEQGERLSSMDEVSCCDKRTYRYLNRFQSICDDKRSYIRHTRNYKYDWDARYRYR